MNIYLKKFRNASLEELKNLKPEEIKIFKNTPIKESLTIVARLPLQALRNIKKLISELKRIEPSHYYYPTGQLHLTILGNIPAEINVKRVNRTIKETILLYSLNFNLWGLGSNVYCSSISAYPISFSIHKLREKLRQKLGGVGADYKKPTLTKQLSLYEYMGWINYLRFLKKPKQKLLDKLYELKDRNFSKATIKRIEVYKNTSKVLDPKKADLISSFNL